MRMWEVLCSRYRAGYRILHICGLGRLSLVIGASEATGD